jgi:hypothetical protein
MSKHADWQLVTPAAQWQPRDSTGECVYDGHLWILGGWYTPQTPNPRDVWKSRDGRDWTRVLEEAPWVQSDLPAAMAFKGKMYMMGGRSLPGTEPSNKVWSTTDGAHWTLVTEAAGWSARLAMGYAVFKDRMWIVGGTETFYDHNEQTMHHDVWSSADGKTWKLETDNAGFTKRAHGQCLVHNGKLWMIGGGSWRPDHIERNDVWYTEDGVHWKQATASAAWAPRIWFGAATYRNHLWMFGGWARNTGNCNDVWYSKNGRDWRQFKTDTIWSPRHEIATWVFDDSIYAAGGEAEPLTGEVWRLHLPEGWDGE